MAFGSSVGVYEYGCEYHTGVAIISCLGYVQRLKCALAGEYAVADCVGEFAHGGAGGVGEYGLGYV